jgi:hypothetical protein
MSSSENEILLSSTNAIDSQSVVDDAPLLLVVETTTDSVGKKKNGTVELAFFIGVFVVLGCCDVSSETNNPPVVFPKLSVVVL